MYRGGGLAEGAEYAYGVYGLSNGGVYGLSNGFDDASIAAAFGGLGFVPSADATAGGGYGGHAPAGMPPMSPRAASQQEFNAQSAAAHSHADLFADPATARWLAGAFGGNFDPERLMMAEQMAAEHARPPSSPGYHSLYKTELCRSWEETSTCRYGSKCQFAHGQDELRPVLRHPRYKTELCRTFATSGTCPYGTRCRFIHYRGAAATATAPSGAKLTVTVPPGSPQSPRVTPFAPPAPLLRAAATPPASPAPAEALHAPGSGAGSPPPRVSPQRGSPPRPPSAARSSDGSSSGAHTSSPESPPGTPSLQYGASSARFRDGGGSNNNRGDAESDDSGGKPAKRLPIFEKLCHAKDAAASAVPPLKPNAGISPPAKPQLLIFQGRSGAVCE